MTTTSIQDNQNSINYDESNKQSRKPSKKSNNEPGWKIALKGIKQTLSSPLFYAKFFCKIGKEIPATKHLASSAKKWIEKPNDVLKTTNYILSIEKYSSSSNHKKDKVNLKEGREILGLFKKTLNFCTLAVDLASIKLPSKITKIVSQIKFALGTFLPFLDFFIKIRKEGWKGLQDISGVKTFYKMGKALLNLYLLCNVCKLTKNQNIALSVTNFTLAHI